MPLWTRKDSEWKSPTKAWVFSSGEWKEIREGWVYSSGAWKKIWPNTPPLPNTTYQKTTNLYGYGNMGDAYPGLVPHSHGWTPATPYEKGAMGGEFEEMFDLHPSQSLDARPFLCSWLDGAQPAPNISHIVEVVLFRPDGTIWSRIPRQNFIQSTNKRGSGGWLIPYPADALRDADAEYGYGYPYYASSGGYAIWYYN